MKGQWRSYTKAYQGTGPGKTGLVCALVKLFKAQIIPDLFIGMGEEDRNLKFLSHWATRCAGVWVTLQV